MFDIKKSNDLLYYLSILNEDELKKDRKTLYQFRKELAKEYREVFDYFFGNNNKLSKPAEEIYRNLLEIKR